MVLGFLDSVLTTLILRETIEDLIKLVIVVTSINLMSAFMAEYVEERRFLERIERILLMRRGSILRTILHKRAVLEALTRGFTYGVISIVGTLIVETTASLASIGGIPIITILVLGAFGTLMSRYFSGNSLVWFVLYAALGFIASFIGLLLGC